MAKALPLAAMNAEGTFGENASLMLLTRFAEMFTLSQSIHDPERVQDLHDMRIAAKRLRYTMEIFQPCFTGAPAKEYKNVYEKVKSIQEQIGDIHDCDVRGPAIQQFLSDHVRRRPEIRVGLERLIEKEKQDRDRMYTEFVAYWSTLVRKGFRARFVRLATALDVTEPGTQESVNDPDGSD
ncbi:MAG TPA: CHAD domain-containing protein [Capsulimonadaceae bacterium]|jgi:CHAD domain-containing protein